jgi:hypothetical protein
MVCLCQRISKHGGGKHPERWNERHRHYRGFPADGTVREQLDWFRRRFLRLADGTSSPKQQGEWLKLAFMATVKAAAVEGKGEPEEELYRQHLERMLASRDQRPRKD